jgi:hypothetical protein
VASEFAWSRVIPRYEAVWEELAEAARREPDQDPEDNPFNVAAAPHFSHYASRVLTDADEVVATGESLLEGAYADVAPWLPAAVVEQVVSAARTPVTVGWLAGAGLAEPAMIRYVVRWLVKYGVVRVRG